MRCFPTFSLIPEGVNKVVTKKQKLAIDSMNGGNGDIWMRLGGLYSVAGLLPHLEISILIPESLRYLARHTFSDRLIILENQSEKIRLRYTSLGLRDLIKGFAKGYRYIVPYHRVVINNRKKKQLKDRINIFVFNIASRLGLVYIPEWQWITSYQGYLDIIGLDILKKMHYNLFVDQLLSDYNLIYTKLSHDIPGSDQLVMPHDLAQNIVVFPNGTGRQFLPVWWAKKYLPMAYFAFYHMDKDVLEFKNSGLKIIEFYQPGDIILLSKSASWTITTDSFPSHLLQSATKNCTITLTEAPKYRIISPAFKGKVVEAEVSCHPCLHLDRKNHVRCEAGYLECLNWGNKIYTNNILNSIPFI
jgi:hypothetical protein